MERKCEQDIKRSNLTACMVLIIGVCFSAGGDGGWDRHGREGVELLEAALIDALRWFRAESSFPVRSGPHVHEILWLYA
ncbi:hypothetical protein QQF64_006914 [Cirrhinus molitorella]|uniref:Uncharacterized protein n=1 Tax=Cirrhinus molitorella TaxID=172907 RepID=A0ABR3M996_9TELE